MSDDKKHEEHESAVLWSKQYGSSIEKESTRSIVILSSCYIDELLGQLLKIVLLPEKRKVDPLFEGPNSPLSSQYAKTEFAYRMGLISHDMYESLTIIRQIRNIFAHRLEIIDFEHADIKKLNLKLYTLNQSSLREGRKAFPDGEVGNFEAVASLMIFMLKFLIDSVSDSCPRCGSSYDYRKNIKRSVPYTATSK